MNSSVILQSQANNSTMDDVMVGFTEEAVSIIDSLIGGLPQLDIVAIVGMGGQGKTTLAKKIYHDPRVRLHFNKFAWCCISQAYKIENIFISILKDVNPTLVKDDVSGGSHEDLAEKLYRYLKGETYLIVLDDIWDIGVWKELKASFPNDENGSRVMFTSRIHRVALEAKPDCSFHELHPLSFEDSWELLQLKLSYKDFFPSNLLSVGKQIVGNCKGLPLAIVVIACLLVKADGNLAVWQQIAESLNTQVTREGCMEILELSYRHLPYYLKPCFLYLAAFKEDELILAKRLIRYWIAEGFIEKHETKSLEDVANEYLMDLVARSLLFVAKRSSTYGIKKCVAHDLVRELGLEKAKEENFLLLPNSYDNHSFDTLNQSYRLCFHTKCWPSGELEPTSPPNVRTLLFSKHSECPSAPSFFICFKLLTILDLAFIYINNPNIDSITELIHLRYLALWGTICVPSSIVNLSKLEFIRLTVNHHPLPNTIWNMKSLRHSYLSSSDFQDTDDLVDDESIQLDNLETFSSYRDCSEEEFKWQLRRIPNVRKLGVKLEFCIRMSNYLSKLESLKFYAPYVNLSAPEFDFPFTLRKLTIIDAILSSSIILAIGKLPNLEVLKLVETDLEDQRWDVEDDEFLNLKYLKLQKSNIEEWNVYPDAFPQLQQLILKTCYYLTEIPCRFAMLPTLKVVKVLWCSYEVKDSVDEIVTEQRDLGNAGLQIRTGYIDGDKIQYTRSEERTTKWWRRAEYFELRRSRGN